jgi:hypothetical protein
MSQTFFRKTNILTLEKEMEESYSKSILKIVSIFLNQKSHFQVFFVQDESSHSSFHKSQ